MIIRTIATYLLWLALLTNLPAQAEEKVIVYNWQEYIPESVLADFTKETGIKVEYSTYTNDEIMYTRLKILKGRGYDVIVPSGSLVSRMREEGLIQQLDFDLLGNMQGLDPSLLNKPYDPENRFSVPYLWGSTGLVVDTAFFEGEEIDSWKALWSNKAQGRVLLIDEVRDVFSAALKMNGYSANSSDSDEIMQAYDDLKKLMPGVKLITGEPQEALVSGEVAIGLSWSGDVTVAREKKKSLKYIYPKEGSSLWVDSFVISAKSTNYRNAHTFINYMLRPEISARCVEEMGYATPVLEAKKLLNDGILNNPEVFPPPEVIQNAEFQNSVTREAMKLYLMLWDKLKGGQAY